MRTTTTTAVRLHAFRVQEVAFYAGAICGLAFIGFAVNAHETGAIGSAIAGAIALGISIGAWVVGARFKD